MPETPTSTNPVAAVVLAAGKGTRMRSKLPKVLHPIANLPMVGHILATLGEISADRIAVIVGPGMDIVSKAVAPVPTAIQHDQLGTADALKAGRTALDGFDTGTVLVIFGDSPFIAPQTLAAMVAQREAGMAVVVLGFEPDNPSGYGRLVTDQSGALQAIVEDRDADEATKKIGLCNSGVMAIDASRLFELVDRITNDNAKGEYYLTDIVSLARADGLSCGVIKATEAELRGVDSRMGQAKAEQEWQDRARQAAMQGGATLLDPSSVYFSYDTELGQDVVIGQNVVFGPGVTVADGVEIKSFSHLEGAKVQADAVVGPFARLRPGTVIGPKAKVGNFVEVKNAVFGQGAKANHLSYVGDADVGEAANIGAGTITCNYDGYLKHRTSIGKAAFIGSNTALVAPVEIGEAATVAAGSTITKSVDPDALAVVRADQKNLPGAAKKIRSRLAARKEAAKKS